MEKKKIAIIGGGGIGTTLSRYTSNSGLDVQVADYHHVKNHVSPNPPDVTMTISNHRNLSYQKPNNEILSNVGCPFDKKGRHKYERHEAKSKLGIQVTFKCVCGRLA